MMKYLLFSVFSFLLVSCGEDKTGVCFSFDIRQCQTDDFAEFVPESDSKSMREDKLKSWMESQGVEIEEVRLSLNFHEAVCEACHVCPQGDRYFVRISDEDDLLAIENLALLSYELLDCNDAF